MLDLSPGQWLLAGSYVSLLTTRESRAITLAYTFSRHLIKVQTQSTSTAEIKVSPRWRRAGYLRQLDANTGGIEISSVTVPLNQVTAFLLPALTDTFKLSFLPVVWLPNITVIIYEYKGDVGTLGKPALDSGQVDPIILIP
ncbi:MAG: hypothetical protein F6K19_42285 [Cyanothece sp. SIO1E1]|nr:hypothetical protein [Cyanothece sp. SIO1E1]